MHICYEEIVAVFMAIPAMRCALCWIRCKLNRCFTHHAEHDDVDPG